MTDEIRNINLVLLSTGLAISVVGLFQVRINSNIEKIARTFLTIMFSLNTQYLSTGN